MSVVDLTMHSTGFGARWGTETNDLNATLVAWPLGSGVAEHINDEVDVIMVVISGEITVEVDAEAHHLVANNLLVIPKGTRRRVEVTSDKAVYLNVHRRRTLSLKPADGYRSRSTPDDQV